VLEVTFIFKRFSSDIVFLNSVNNGFDHPRDRLCSCHLLKNRDEHEKLVIVYIRIPRLDRYSIERMHAVSNWRIVNNDQLLKRPVQKSKVLDVTSINYFARFSIKSVSSILFGVDNINDFVRVLFNRCCKVHNFKVLRKLFQKSSNMRSYKHVYWNVLVFKEHRDFKVMLVTRLKTRVNESLVEIKQKSFQGFVLWVLFRKDTNFRILDLFLFCIGGTSQIL